VYHQTFICGDWVAAKSAVYRDRPRKLNDLKTAMAVYFRNISQADLQKLFANKIKRVQARLDARGQHFLHTLAYTVYFLDFIISVQEMRNVNCRFPPYIIVISHFYLPTNALNYNSRGR
jgi:hypothetical protein